MTLKVGVIGAGSLGTALSQTISENVDQLLLHVITLDTIRTIILTTNYMKISKRQLT